MKLGFGHIDIRDFKSIKRLKFNFDRPFGLYFIIGDNKLEPRLESNGVGKSSLFDALSWCLYGKTPSFGQRDGLRSPDIVPWGGGHPHVSLLVVLDGATEHSIERTHNPNTLKLDEADVAQEAIDKLIGMNQVTLCHTLLLGQGRPLFFDLTPGQKLDLFADVLDLQRWDQRSDKANTAARGLALHNAAAERSLQHLRARHTELGLQYRDLKTKSNAWEETAQRIVTEGEAKIAELRKQVEQWQPLVDEADLAYDGARSELDPLREQITDLVRKQLANAQRLREFEQLAKGRNCPTCGQPLPNRRLVTPAQLKGAKATDADLRRRLALLHEADAKFIRQRDAARAQLDLRGPALTAAKTRLTLLQDQLTRDQHEGNPFRPLLAATKQERFKLKGDFEALRKSWKQDRRKQARIEFWIKGFKDVKLHIIEEVLGELQLTANAMLEQAGLIGWQLHFEAERETQKGTVQRGLNVFVQSPHNDKPVKWECWSGGEGQRLRVIGALALGEVLLNRAGIEPGLEVLDEPTSHLSPRGRYDLIDLLYERARGLGRTIYYADQTVVASDRFAAVLTVERSSKGTRICYQ